MGLLFFMLQKYDKMKLYKYFGTDWGDRNEMFREKVIWRSKPNKYRKFRAAMQINQRKAFYKKPKNAIETFVFVGSISQRSDTVF